MGHTQEQKLFIYSAPPGDPIATIQALPEWHPFRSELIRLGVDIRRLHERDLPVVYPGLESHPQHELFCAQLNEGYGFGGLLTLDLGSLGRANAFMEHLQNRHGFGFMAVSLGYSDTLMSASGASTSSELPDDALEDAGIGAGLVRLSMGYTGTLEQRWDQLEDTLRYVGMLG